jgi:hypothetical protein
MSTQHKTRTFRAIGVFWFIQTVLCSGTLHSQTMPGADTLAPTKEQIFARVIRESLQTGATGDGPFRSGAREGDPAVISPAEGSKPALMKEIAYGAVYPEYEFRESTKGSRYLLEKFVRGVIIDKKDHIIKDTSLLLNYDKMSGQLMIAEDNGNSYMAIDKDNVIAFGLMAPDTSYVFLNVPVLSLTDYYMLVANGPKFGIYKTIQTKFHKLDLHSANINEAQNNSDEYIDKPTYYWVARDNSSGSFTLNKRSIRASFTGKTDKIDAFFASHKHEEIDESLLRSLVTWLND